jgi:hypothetical protein
MWGAIDSLHVELVEKLTLRLILVYYWNRHDDHNVILQVVCDNNLIFWDVIVLAPCGTKDATHFWLFSLYNNFMHRVSVWPYCDHWRPRRVTLHCWYFHLSTFDQHHEGLHIKKIKGWSKKELFNKALQNGHVNQNMLIWAKKGVRSHWKLQTIIVRWLVHELGALSLKLKV